MKEKREKEKDKKKNLREAFSFHHKRLKR